jgi:folate-binding protein YgfZ
MLLVRALERAQLVLTGEDRVRFLHGMVTNDVEALKAGQGCHAAMLTTKGKMLADLVIHADAESLTLVLDFALREKIRTALDKHIVMDDVELADVSDGVVTGVYGDEAAAVVAAAIGADAARLRALPNYGWIVGGMVGQARVAQTPELGLPGFHVFGAAVAAPQAEVLSAEAYEALRIEAGTPRYGVDMGEDRLPIEAGIADAVSFTKGCYLGQEVIARATNLGHINRKLVGLWLDGEVPATPLDKLSAPSRPDAGFVTSSIRSQRFGRAIALAYVHRTLWDPGTELTLSEGRRATVTALPFTT